jgi:gamma-glutamyl-gamma-aminobutyrate hydrolase PuuD
MREHRLIDIVFLRFIGIALLAFVFNGCDSSIVNSLQNQGKVTVRNNLTLDGKQIDGVIVAIDGEQIASLLFGQFHFKLIGFFYKLQT